MPKPNRPKKLRAPKVTYFLQQGKYYILKYVNEHGKVSFSMSSGLITSREELPAFKAQNAEYLQQLAKMVLDGHAAGMTGAAIREQVGKAFSWQAYATATD